MVLTKTFNLFSELLFDVKSNYSAFIILNSHSETESDVIGKYSCVLLNDKCELTIGYDTADKDSIFYNKNDSQLINLGLECIKLVQDKKLSVINPDFPVIECEGYLFPYKPNTIPCKKDKKEGRIKPNDISNINYIIKIFDLDTDFSSAMCNMINCLDAYIYYTIDKNETPDNLCLNVRVAEANFTIRETKKKLNFSLFKIIINICWPLIGCLKGYNTNLYNFIQNRYIKLVVNHELSGNSSMLLEHERDHVKYFFKNNKYMSIFDGIDNANAIISYVNALKKFSKTIQPYEKFIFFSNNDLPESDNIKNIYILGTFLRVLDDYKEN